MSLFKKVTKFTRNAKVQLIEKKGEFVSYTISECNIVEVQFIVKKYNFIYFLCKHLETFIFFFIFFGFYFFFYLNRFLYSFIFFFFFVISIKFCFITHKIMLDKYLETLFISFFVIFEGLFFFI